MSPVFQDLIAWAASEGPDISPLIKRLDDLSMSAVM